MKALQIAGFILTAGLHLSGVAANSSMEKADLQSSLPRQKPDRAVGQAALEDGIVAEKSGNIKRAVRSYLRAVKNENYEAAKRLGDIFWDGKGDVEKDRSEALRFYNLAEKNGIKVDRKK